MSGSCSNRRSRLDVRRLSWGKRRKKGDGVRTVIVQTTGVIKDPDHLANLVLVVAAALDQLVEDRCGTP